MTMDLSLFLSKLLGLYLTITCGLFLLYPRKEVQALLEAFTQDTALIVFSGAMTLLLGLALVIGHPIWEWSFRGVITVLGWITVLKGVLRLGFPQVTRRLAASAVRQLWYTPLIVLFALIGVWLTYVGFTG